MSVCVYMYRDQSEIERKARDKEKPNGKCTYEFEKDGRKCAKRKQQISRRNEVKEFKKIRRVQSGA